jgi:hypothetical protein
MEYVGLGIPKSRGEFMWMTLAIAATVYSLLNLCFGKFEDETPLLPRVLKLVIYLSITALLAWVGPWALLWVLGLLAAGSVVHWVWCAHNGINPLSAEPKERYYRLRSWRPA